MSYRGLKSLDLSDNTAYTAYRPVCLLPRSFSDLIHTRNLAPGITGALAIDTVPLVFTGSIYSQQRSPPVVTVLRLGVVGACCCGEALSTLGLWQPIGDVSVSPQFARETGGPKQREERRNNQGRNRVRRRFIVIPLCLIVCLKWHHCKAQPMQSVCLCFHPAIATKLCAANTTHLVHGRLLSFDLIT